MAIDRLELPLRLRGGWDQALFLTYGADLGFLESALYRDISTARNVIVLADHLRLLETLSRQATHRTARAINRSYLVSGVKAGHAMHAKAILLTSETQGRLLVGSGNLSLQGYASGGEVFTEFEFTEDDVEAPGAFHQFWSFIRGLGNAGLLYGAAASFVERFGDRAPWLLHSDQNGASIWHNLDQPLITQLAGLVGDEPVERFWVLAPFHDESGTALKDLVARLRPSSTYVLVQPGRTSANPVALRNLADTTTLSVLAVGEANRDPYLHAKLVLIDTPERAICVGGSANLSQVALLNTANSGNVELATVAVRPRGGFDYLIDELAPREVDDLDALDISIEPYSPAEIEGAAELRLTAAVLIGSSLTIQVEQPAPSANALVLKLDDDDRAEFEVASLPTSHTLELPPEIATKLSDSPAVSIRVTFTHGEEVTSNHVFPVLVDALERKLQGSARPTVVDRVGDLGLEDEDLEELFRQLNSLLMIDDRSIWQAARGNRQRQPDDEGAPMSLSYEDVDYERLRQHPKLRQYQKAAHGGTLAPLPVQAILRSITAHFEQFPEAHPFDTPPTGLLNDGESDTEDEREEDDRERQRRRWSTDQRLRRIVENFIQRYLRGLGSPAFQDVAGPEVMAQNFVIFNHLLWRLFTKEWADAQLVSHTCANMWALFWGRMDTPGYWMALTVDERTAAEEWIAEHQTPTVVISSLVHGAQSAMASHNDGLIVDLRDTWRFAVTAGVLEADADTLQKASSLLARLLPYDPPGAADIAARLAWLADYDTRGRFLAWAGHHAGCGAPPTIERVKVARPMRGDAMVDRLMLPGGRLTIGLAESIIARWMRVEAHAYYRVESPRHEGMFVDLEAGKGAFWDRNREIIAIERVEPAVFPWDEPLAGLRLLAAEGDVHAVA